MNRIAKYVVGTALWLMVSTANSGMIELRPHSPSVAPGGTITFDLFADFGTQVTWGGAVDITFDPDVLSFGSFGFDSNFGPVATDHTPPNRDTFFDVLPSKPLSPPGLVTIGFGNPAGITGAFTVGELVFTASPNAPKTGPITLVLDASAMWGGFVGPPLGAPIMPFQYVDTTISAVPLPPTAWLFASGLAVLGMLRLRRQLGGMQAETTGSFA